MKRLMQATDPRPPGGVYTCRVWLGILSQIGLFIHMCKFNIVVFVVMVPKSSVKDVKGYYYVLVTPSR